MGFFELFLLGVGLSMDAFAVSVCKGLAMKKATLKSQMTCGLWFGGFQALMPLIGFFLGAMFADAIKSFDHWIAFGLLALIGANMLKEALEKECDCCDEHNADMSVKTMFVLAVATSIDALAVGISLAMAGDVNIWAAIALIGVTTCGLSALPEELQAVARLRLEHPEMSLRDLGAAMDPPLSRSGINHRLQRIIKFAEGLE